MNDQRTCLQCQQPFEPRRVHQKFCSKACRLAAHQAHPSDQGPSAQVKTVRVLSSGKISMTVNFDAIERERAIRFAPKQPVQVIAA
jgi:hypothetical protein